MNPQKPSDFVYLKDIDPGIIQKVRYFGSDNFVGRPIRGYQCHCIMMTRSAALALKEANEAFRKQGFTIVVYDAYRPQQAVDHFIEWGNDLHDTSQKNKFYPTIEKADIFNLGYVAKRSAHTRGSCVDITLVESNKKIKPVRVIKSLLTSGEKIDFLDDSSFDMGSHFDFLHPASHHDSDLVDEIYKERRVFLRTIMEAHGFKAYEKEWWHYVLRQEPYPETYFNFPVL